MVCTLLTWNEKRWGPRIPQGFPKPRLWYLYSMRSKNKEQLSLVLCFCGPLYSIVSGGFPLQPFDTDTPSITWLEICGLLPFHLQEILEPLLIYRFSQSSSKDFIRAYTKVWTREERSRPNRKLNEINVYMKTGHVECDYNNKTKERLLLWKIIKNHQTTPAN